ncbi:cysteine methyltransferase [Pasteurellaceae bacterium Macca]|nr:cysteine methyltransferase [Pasteurellaceae bacterium Macca]
MTSSYYDFYPSPLGDLLMIANEQGLLLLEFEQQAQGVDLRRFHAFNSAPQNPKIATIFAKTTAILDRYFAGEKLDFSHLDFLAPQGTPFQQAVWQQLRTIHYGEINHYSDIAQRLNNPKAVRAVGGAVGRNPISILIPCHRVLGKDHTLTGFGGGLPAKRYLLQLENIPYKDKGVEFVGLKLKHWKGA